MGPGGGPQAGSGGGAHFRNVHTFFHNSSLSHLHAAEEMELTLGTKGVLFKVLPRLRGRAWHLRFWSLSKALSRSIAPCGNDRTAVRVRPRPYTAASSYQCIRRLLLHGTRAYPGHERAIGRALPSLDRAGRSKWGALNRPAWSLSQKPPNEGAPGLLGEFRDSEISP